MSHFDQVANEWDSPEKRKLITLTAKKMIESLRPKHHLSILDFGCGTGLLSEHFIPFAHKLTGIDTSKKMLEIFDIKFKEHANVKSQKVDLEIENINEKYDLILSSMAFHHLNTADRVLQKLSSSLKPDGKIAIVDLDKEDGSFHPDNQKMGVKHFGFSKEDILSWNKKAALPILHHSIIHHVEKNNQKYPLFLAIFEK